MERAIERFERRMGSRYPNSTTARHYVNDLRQFDRLVGKPPRAVSREDVDRFVEDQLERGLSARTINRRLAALHEFFEYVSEETEDPEWPNPVNWKRHKVKPGKRLPRDISDMEVKRLFAEITHPRDRAMFRLMLDVGLRVGEVIDLRVSDVTIVDDGSLGRLRVRGKGSKERFVWLLAETLSIIQTWLEQRPEVEDERLFLTRRKQGFSVRGVQERLAHYSRLAGIQVSPHQLRHTFGRRMAEAEMPVTSLAAWMGHEQITTTQIYIAGAGVEVQADYQVAIQRLMAGSLEDVPDRKNEEKGVAIAGGELDVWRLAGVERTSVAQSQPVEVSIDLSRYWEGLPEWLTERLEEYIIYQQRRWKPHQVGKHTSSRLHNLRRVWRWVLDEEQISSISDLQRAQVERFVEVRLASSISSATVNSELTDLWAFLRYLEERGEEINASVFRVKRPKRTDAVPRFLSETEFQRLVGTVIQTTEAGERDDLLDRAWFYLFSDAGLRIGEACNLRLGDVDLAAQRLIVRHGKNNRDRVVPLSPTLIAVLTAYLLVRGEAQTDHLLIYRQQPLRFSLIRHRLHRYGQQAQVDVSPHRLRHTMATRLLNEGMPITSLRRLLGHEKLETTLIYARVHDDTVRRDYERARARLTPPPSLADEFFSTPTEVAQSHSPTVEVNRV